jgi:hypothetical protein
MQSLNHGCPDPEYVVCEGLLPLAEDERHEVTLLIDLSWYASQPEEGVIIYIVRVSVSRLHQSLTQCRIAKLVW